MLGVPRGYQQDVRAWSATIEEFRDQEVPDLDSLAVDAYRSFLRMVLEFVDLHVDEGRSAKQSGTLVDAVALGGMTKVELVSMFVLRLFARHVTTTNLISSGSTRSGTAARGSVCADCRRWPGPWSRRHFASTSPSSSTPRTAREGYVLHGTDVGAGEAIRPVLGSANRDEAEFEGPDCFDVGRSNNARQLAFGFGPYFCLGSALARREGQEAFATLTRRFPRVELGGADLVRRPTGNLRGVAALPVRLA